MSDTFQEYEPLIRVVTFGAILLVMAVWEIAASRRPQMLLRGQRWPANLLIVALDTLAVRLIFPLTAIGASVLAAGQGWGLFNMTPVPTWLAVIGCVVLLDMAIYFQHRLFHAVPWLWRHVPRASFRHTPGNQQQFRLQSAVVGPSVRDLC